MTKRDQLRINQQNYLLQVKPISLRTSKALM